MSALPLTETEEVIKGRTTPKPAPAALLMLLQALLSMTIVNLTRFLIRKDFVGSIYFCKLFCGTFCLVLIWMELQTLFFVPFGKKLVHRIFMFSLYRHRAGQSYSPFSCKPT